MKLGVTTAFSHHTPVDFIRGVAERLDRAGIATVWVPEHVVFLPEYESRYPYSDDGRVPRDPVGVLDPFSCLSFIAAATTNIRLGTGICIVPQRQPLYTAKMVADLDYLSQGRVDFGIGVGWLEEEFDALGMDFSTRGARCDEYLSAMKAVWTTEPASFNGETVSFGPVHFNPKPEQKPHPPIWVGGESKPAIRRVARHADGWYCFSMTIESLDAGLARLDEELAAVGRSRENVRIVLSPKDPRIGPDEIAAYADRGVEQIILPFGARDLDGVDRRIERLAESTGLL